MFQSRSTILKDFIKSYLKNLRPDPSVWLLDNAGADPRVYRLTALEVFCRACDCHSLQQSQGVAGDLPGAGDARVLYFLLDK